MYVCVHVTLNKLIRYLSKGFKKAAGLTGLELREEVRCVVETWASAACR